MGCGEEMDHYALSLSPSTYMDLRIEIHTDYVGLMPALFDEDGLNSAHASVVGWGTDTIDIHWSPFDCEPLDDPSDAEDAQGVLRVGNVGDVHTGYSISITTGSECDE